jgi:hypothetical protein
MPQSTKQRMQSGENNIAELLNTQRFAAPAVLLSFFLVLLRAASIHRLAHTGHRSEKNEINIEDLALPKVLAIPSQTWIHT